MDIQAPEAPAMKNYCSVEVRKDADAGSVDATRRISSSSLRMCARQDCLCLSAPKLCFTVTSAAPDT